jgi:CPA2 family monovalent cation:H+ antiporter-2
VVIDYDRRTVRRLNEAGVPALYGDASREEVLRPAHPDTAASAVIALPDDMVAAMVIRRLHALNPELPVVARGHTDQALDLLAVEGADEVVSPEFEAGLEMVRHALLHHHGLDPTVIDQYLGEQRDQRYHPHHHPDETEALETSSTAPFGASPDIHLGGS